jgi:hypothetical protein
MELLKEITEKMLKVSVKRAVEITKSENIE